MKPSIFIMSILIGLSSCAQDNTKSDVSLEDGIKGTWKTDYFKGEWRDFQLVFSFYDSTCSYPYPWGENYDYWLDGDTIIVNQIVRKNGDIQTEEKVISKFLINNLTLDELSISPITEQTRKLFDYSQNLNFDSIHLKKVKSQFDWNIKRIGFYSTGCYGSCPSMYLEIDSLGNIIFNGKNYTEKEGLFSGKLSPQLMKSIESKINCLELNQLKRIYMAGWTDDQTCGVLIETSDQIFKSSAYGFDKEPIELRILFNSLMELYKSVELSKDSAAQDKFRFKDFQKLGSPPPIPPPPPPPSNNE